MENIDDKIKKLIGEKVPVTSLVASNSFQWFQVIKSEIKKLSVQLHYQFNDKPNSIIISYDEKGERQCTLRVGEDLLYFYLQNNTFRFDDNHHLFKSSYVKSNPYNAFCGVINVYNFLSDSILKSRENDMGFLLARIFINRENHFYVEGKKQIGLLFNDFSNDEIDSDKVIALIKNILVFSIEHDLFPAPFESVQSITVNELQNHIFSSSLATGKTLGFRLQKDSKTGE